LFKKIKKNTTTVQLFDHVTKHLLSQMQMSVIMGGGTFFQVGGTSAS